MYCEVTLIMGRITKNIHGNLKIMVRLSGIHHRDLPCLLLIPAV